MHQFDQKICDQIDIDPNTDMKQYPTLNKPHYGRRKEQHQLPSQYDIDKIEILSVYTDIH